MGIANQDWNAIAPTAWSKPLLDKHSDDAKTQGSNLLGPESIVHGKRFEGDESGRIIG